MARSKSRSSNGKAAEATASSSTTKLASFDAELDALFSAVPVPVVPVAGPSKPSPQSKSLKRKVEESLDAEDEEEVNEEDEELEEDEDDEGEVAALLSNDGVSEAKESGEEDNLDVDSSDSEADTSRLVHETLANGQKATSAKTSKKGKTEEEPRGLRDRRSLFVGNLPVSLVKSRLGLKNLKKHLLTQSPYPSLTQIQSIRLRSIPFSKPTDDYDARNPEEADKKMRRRERSQAYKEALSATAAGDGDSHAEAKKYLSGAQKRKVAFITQQVNEKADSINAYVTLAPITSKMIKARAGDDNDKASRVTATVLAALLARCAHGTVFEERHLRVDLVTALEPAEMVEAGLDTIQSADGSLIGVTSGASSVDREGRKRTAFVGNMDFEVREEEVRDFFNLLLAGEKGEAPHVPKLDFSRCTVLPAPENTLHTLSQDDDEQERSWVQDVRIIRDSATQMGKGFGYVRFLEAACVDEVLAIHESEQAFVAAAKAGKATASGPFRRKLKLKGRALRVSRCKVPKGNVTPAKRDAVNGGLSVQTPKGSKMQRTRSTGAPTPGGSSPFAKKQRLNANGASSPTKRAPNGKERNDRSNTDKILPNPAPQYTDPLKAAEVAKKKADPERQARRMAKKNAKRTAQKMHAVAADIGATGKVSLKPKKSSGGGGEKKPYKRAGNRGAATTAKRIMGKAAMLATMLAFICAAPAQANNEIANFGPIFCPADETGHLQGKAARQLSHSWPILYPLTGPQLFTLDPVTQPDVWLVLATDAKDTQHDIDIFATSLTPEQLSTPSFPILSRGHNDAVTPRDQWLAALPRSIRWYAWSKRFAFRVNWPANFGLRVTATVHTPRSMLAAGRTRWLANEHDIYEHRRTADDDAEAPQWPCPHVYAHLHVEQDLVPIPPRRAPEAETTEKGVRRRVYDALVDLAELYIGPLTNEPRGEGEEAGSPYPVPVHLVLEPLYIGFFPHTALSLLAVLLPVLVLAYIFVVPLVERIVADVMLEPENITADDDRKTQ